MVSIDAITAIANKELTDRLRSRWVLVIAITFALFTLAISYFGSAPSGMAGFRRLDATLASLTSLVTYFIPILALTLGAGIIIDERDRGTLDLFLSSPISFIDFLLGKFAGLVAAFTVSTIAGLGISGIIIIINTGIGAMKGYLIFMVNSILFGLTFLSLSFLISVIFEERSRVIAFTIFLWLFLAILYDLGLVGLLIVTKGGLGDLLFSILLLMNPVDIYRILNFLSLGESTVFLGLASVEFPGLMKAPLLWAISLVWVVLLMMASYYLFRRRYLK